MSTVSEEGESEPLPPDAAFSALGNETRIHILQTLGEAKEPLPFTELRDRIGIDPGGLFNYHLDQLVDHFVTKTDVGYELRAPGSRVVKAVLSGSVAEPPATDREEIGESCQLCRAPIEVRYRKEAVETFCTECSGMWSNHESDDEGYLGRKLLPPAGVKDRDPETMYRAAWMWSMSDIFSMACGLCPSCSATLDTSVKVCNDHTPDGSRCSVCENRYATKLFINCTNCILDLAGSLPMALANHTALLDFLTDHGLNPVAPDSTAAVQRFFSDYNEEILSTDPFKANLTFKFGDDSITLNVDETLSVIGVDRTD